MELVKSALLDQPQLLMGQDAQIARSTKFLLMELAFASKDLLTTLLEYVLLVTPFQMDSLSMVSVPFALEI